jgi:acyl-coenzyme A thioesterase PaaI-like protein
MSVDSDRLRASFAGAPFVIDLGIAPTEAAEGRVVTLLRLAPRHRPHAGVIHAALSRRWWS